MATTTELLDPSSMVTSTTAGSCWGTWATSPVRANFSGARGCCALYARWQRHSDGLYEPAEKLEDCRPRRRLASCNDPLGILRNASVKTS